MAQQKKPLVRGAILDAAFDLFSTKGYSGTTITEIGRRAGTSTANVYVYFESKLEILYAIYDPWLRERVATLERAVSGIASADERLRFLLRSLWRDIPAEENGFANNLMQAASAAHPGEGYSPALVLWFEERIASMIHDALPPARRALFGEARIGQLLIMAFDGIVINRHLFPQGEVVDDSTLGAVVMMLLGRTGPAKSSWKSAASRRVAVKAVDRAAGKAAGKT